MSDEELVERARCGDRDAFGRLAQKHRAMCLGLGCLYMRNYHDAEDVVQTALMKAYIHLDQFTGAVLFSTWLGSIVINQSLMALRSIRSRRYTKFPRVRNLHYQGCNPEQLSTLAQLRECVRAEIRRIPPLYRMMFIKDLEDLTLPQVADRLGLSIEAAKSRLLRARAELRRHVEARLGTRKELY